MYKQINWKLIRGTASNVGLPTVVMGSIPSQHRAILEINGTPVEINVFGTIVINNGDDIAVVGTFHQGRLKAIAYKS